MHYKEFEQVPSEQREDSLRRLAVDDLRDIIDQIPYPVKPPSKRPDYVYFDDLDQLHLYLLRHWAPEAKPWRADEAAEHEAAHGRYALAIGAVSVRYGVPKSNLLDPVVAEVEYANAVAGVPNLMATAVAANPLTSMKSPLDRDQMVRYGYPSRQYVAERIERWNEQGFGPTLPQIETLDEHLTRLELRSKSRL